MNTLGGDGSLHYSFRAVVRRHLEQLGPRTGVWEAVRGMSGLVGGDMSKLECCKAWTDMSHSMGPIGFKVCPWSCCATTGGGGW